MKTTNMLNVFKKLLGIGNHENLATLIKEGAFLVDVRTEKEFADGSVHGAFNIPLHKLASQVAKVKEKKIIVFCRSGSRSG